MTDDVKFTSVQDFLLQNPVQDMKTNVVVSERLKDYPFEIRAITAPEYESYQKMCFKNPLSKKKREFDNAQFNRLIVINHVTNPSFKDTNFLSRMTEGGGNITPDMALNKYLTGGEITRLSDKILTFSGFNEDLEDVVDEAKNF